LLCAVAADTNPEHSLKVKRSPSGQPQSRRDGTHTDYYGNGTIKRRARYLGGKLDGPYLEKTPDGQKRLTAEYRGGKLHGTLTSYPKGKAILTLGFRDGVPLYERSVGQIRRKLAEINTPTGPIPDPAAADRAAALRRLRSYRYLAGVPCDNLVLKDEMNR